MGERRPNSRSWVIELQKPLGDPPEEARVTEFLIFLLMCTVFPFELPN